MDYCLAHLKDQVCNTYNRILHAGMPNNSVKTYIEIYLLAELGIQAIQRCIENGLRVM